MTVETDRASLFALDRSTIAARLAEQPTGSRGDHDLNPGFGPTRSPLQPAAVLIALVDRPDGFTVLFTRRTAHLNAHAGQISFPGGRTEPGDHDAVATALRETEEEVGLPALKVEIVGRLDRYVTRTGFDVIPIVGFVTPPFPVVADPYEVDEVFEAPLSFLVDQRNRRRDSLVFQGKTRYFHAIPYGDHYIWGATAGMLVNLAARLVPEQDSPSTR